MSKTIYANPHTMTLIGLIFTLLLGTSCDSKAGGDQNCTPTTYQNEFDIDSGDGFRTYQFTLSGSNCRMTTNAVVQGTGTPPGSESLTIARTGTEGGASDFSDPERTPNGNLEGPGWTYVVDQARCGASPGQTLGCVNGTYTIAIRETDGLDFGTVSMTLNLTN
ncbi:MAG: hypothetical protein AAFV29_06815 [Myxococcota bacterium]